MHYVQASNKINLPTLIFQDLIKVVQGSMKTIPYSMHINHIIRNVGCNVIVDPLLQMSKYTSFDKNTFGQMHYVMDIHGNYVKKPGRAPKQHEHEWHDKAQSGHHQLHLH